MPVATPGIRKAAVLSMLLGQDTASLLLQQLNEEEVEAIAQEVARMSGVPAAAGQEVLEEFHQMWIAAEHIARGGVDAARSILIKTFGSDEARRMIDRLVKTNESKMVFSVLDKADPQHLSKFILSEHPQTIALILAHLKPAQSAELVGLLPEQLRVNVLTRMASLDEIPLDVIVRISSVIEERLKVLGGSTHESYGGVRAVAELLNRLDRGLSQGVLGSIEGGQPELAMAIRNLMFVFEDLLHVEDQSIREIVQRADKRVLTMALKGSSEEIRAKFLKNMSARAAEMIREEMEVLGAVRMRDVEKAQHDVVAIARKLEEEGLLVTGAAGGEAYVV
ncbi:MAG: flagellar motor switch protein FliG [Vicinamibacterales bacterium]|nr:flagellar motor switch protein FliG [Vicinamibacterales bacterium]